MDEKNKPQTGEQHKARQPATDEKVKNPFENNQSVDKDIEQSQEELENEQQFKETLTERD
jgi:hypothetical protein